jgi:hypothetical protein
LENDYKKGDLIVLSDGAYSDYSFFNVAEVLKDFDALYIADFISRKSIREGVHYEFITYLENGGYIKLREEKELHMGSLSEKVFKNYTSKRAIGKTPLEAVPFWTNEVCQKLKSYGLRTVEDVYCKVYYWNSSFIPYLGADPAELRAQAVTFLGEWAIKNITEELDG